MNNIRRQELRRIAAAMKSLSVDLASISSREKRRSHYGVPDRSPETPWHKTAD